MNRWAWGIVVFVLVGCAARASEMVWLRSGSEPLIGSVLEFDEQGITLEIAVHEQDVSVTRTVAWTNVRALEPSPEPLSEMAVAFQTGTDVWRAAERLERGDIPGAFRLLEPHADSLMGKQGPVSAQLSEGLLACWLWMGDWPCATAAWISFLANEPESSRYPWVMLDPDAYMVESLPPIFSNAEAGRAFLEYSTRLQIAIESDGRVGAILRLYAMSASDACGVNGADTEFGTNVRTEIMRAVGRDEDVLLVADMVIAQSADGEERTAAQGRLLASASRRPSDWKSTWAGLATGCSLVSEFDVIGRRRGIVTLVDTAIKADIQYPILAARAWDIAARAADSLGDSGAARIFDAELNTRFPGYGLRSPSASPASSLEGPDS